MIEKLPSKIEKTLNDMLLPEEEIHFQLKGAFKEGLVCTNKRVIILKSGLMTGQVFGSDAFQQPYSNIAGVQVKYNLMSGYFELSAGGMQNTVKNYWSTDKNSDPAKAPNCISLNSKSQANKFREACNFIMSKIDELHTPSSPVVSGPVQSAQDDPMEALEKLGKLKTAGVLTDEEFQAKKAELLARI